MRDEILSALRVICNRLGTSGWYVIGSASLALQGLEFEPHDIDIKASSENLARLVEPAEYCSSGHCVTEVEGVKVEIIEKDYPEDVWSPPNKGFEPDMVELKEMRIPVYPLKECLRAYRAMGRQKDAEKIRKIEMALSGSAKL